MGSLKDSEGNPLVPYEDLSSHVDDEEIKQNEFSRALSPKISQEITQDEPLQGVIEQEIHIVDNHSDQKSPSEDLNQEVDVELSPQLSPQNQSSLANSKLEQTIDSPINQ